MSWVTYKLGDYYDVRDGTHDSPKYVEQGYPLITSKNLKNGKLDLNNVQYITKEDYESISKRSGVKVGDVLLAMIGTIGNPVVVDIDQQFAIKNVALIKTNQQQSPDFLRYYLMSPLVAEQMKKDAKGATQKFVGLGYLRNFTIKAPSLHAQQKLVAKLDAIFGQIDKATLAAETNANNTEALFQSYLTEIYQSNKQGWVKKKFSEIAEIKGGKRVPKGLELTKQTTPYPYLRVTNFSESGDIDTTDLMYADNEIYNQIKRYIITRDDLYISIAGTIGRTGIVSNELSGSLLTENACRLVFNEGINNKFVYFFTKSVNFINQTVEQTRTTAQPKLALSRLSEITLSIPSPEEQLKVVKKLELLSSNIQSCRSYYAAKVNEFAKLKQSVLQNAFSCGIV